METTVYVDVLLVVNFAVNTLLVLCMCKLTGARPGRCRIVAAALIGSAGSLTIFLPFLSFLPSLLVKLGLSALIVLAACPFRGGRFFLKSWFAFFTVSFFFAGVMLALWVAFSPRGMVYYNGVVYFDINALVLVGCTAAAYLVLSLGQRFARGGRLHGDLYRAVIWFGDRSAEVTGLVDTGNALYEPFSGMPVMVCNLEDLEKALPPELMEEARRGRIPESGGRAIRLIPYRTAGKQGMLPAVRPDRVELERGGVVQVAERVYVALSDGRIGGNGYNAVLNPDLAALPPRRGREAKGKAR